jgi:protein-disulfide isomerase
VNTGKVRFGFMHFVFLGDESQWAAEASECAADQDKFWEYHDLLFEKQSGENQGTFVKDNLKKFAADLGLDQKKFDDCLDSGKYTSLVQAQTSFSQQLGVSSTPSFVVNDQPVIGAQPFATFQKLIEAGLSQ